MSSGVEQLSTVKVHKKCKFYNMHDNKCNLTHALRKPWDDACESYELKNEFKVKFEPEGDL